MVTLDKNKIIKLFGGGQIQILEDEPFDGGGQGNVYHVNYENRTCVLKWYDRKSILENESFYKNLLKLAEHTPIDGFVWPKRVTQKLDGHYGYVMEEIPNSMTPISEVLSGNVKISEETIRKICYNAAKFFERLHNEDLCFKDLNDSNIFLNADTGEVMICDCDNISYSDQPSAVIGKMGYMAPEICRGDTAPNLLSDRFSLAVIIYTLIVRDYPLRGKKTRGYQNENDDMVIHGTNPIFTMDPDDDSNRPLNDETIHTYENLPDDIKNAFMKSFTTGLNNPEERLSESKWISILDPSRKTKISLERFRKSVPKRLQLVIFIVDSSHSMGKNNKIDEVNKALDSAIPEIKDAGGADTVIKANILQFSDDAEWVFEEPQDCAELISLDKLETTGDWTNFEKACIKLDEFLSDENLSNNGSVNSPLLILLTDGNPVGYEKNLEQLWENKWFIRSHKVSIGIDDDKNKADPVVLEGFTRSNDFVLTTNEIQGKLGTLIKNITIRVTKIVTNSGNGKDLAEIIKKMRG